MSTLPRISIVIPNYNYARFLPDALRSAAEQTYLNTELVVVDDYSTDGSMDVLAALTDQYADRFAGGIRVERFERNMGAHTALNRGIEMADGDYAAIMNADDMFEPDRLAKMHDAMEQTGARLAFSDVACIDGEGRAVHSEFADKLRSLPKSTADRPFTALAAIAENVAVSTGNMLMDRALHAELGGFCSYRYVHDYDFLSRAALATEPVYVPGTQYLYRLHGDNTFTKLQDIGIAENRLVWLEMYRAIKRGEVSNPVILQHTDYREMLRDAADAYGPEKKAVWRIAGTPLGALASAAMHAKLRRSAKKSRA